MRAPYNQSYFTITRPAWNVLGNQLPEMYLCHTGHYHAQGLEFIPTHLSLNAPAPLEFETLQSIAKFLNDNQGQLWSDGQKRQFLINHKVEVDQVEILMIEPDDQYMLRYFADVKYNRVMVDDDRAL